MLLRASAISHIFLPLRHTVLAFLAARIDNAVEDLSPTIRSASAARSSTGLNASAPVVLSLQGFQSQYNKIRCYPIWVPAFEPETL